MARGLIALILILAVVLGGAYVVPRLVDWSEQRAAIAERFSAQLGRDVEIAGSITARLLPRPYLAVRDLRVAAPDGVESAHLLTADAAELTVDFWPLLAGQVEVASLRLFEPEVTLTRQRDGTASWTLPALAEGADGGLQGLPVEALQVRDGQVTLRDPWMPEQRLTGIDGSARLTEQGSRLTVGATAAYRGTGLELEGDVTRLGSGRPNPVSIDIAARERPARARLSVLRRNDGGWQGEVTMQAGDLGGLLAAWGVPRAALPPVAYSEAELAADVAGESELRLTDMRAQLGPARATGTATLAWPSAEAPGRGDVTLEVSRLNVAEMRAAADPPAETAAAAQPLALAGEKLANLRLPQAWEGRLRAQAATLVWQDQVARQLGLDLRYGDGEATIEQAEAVLPGSAEVSVTGTLTGARDGEPPAADLTTSIDAGNLRRTLAWLGVPVETVARGRMRGLALEADITGWHPAWEVPGFTLSLDNTAAEGALAVNAGGERLGLGLRAQADHLDADAYLGAGAGERLADWAGSLDANLDLELDRLTLDGRSYNDVALDALVQDGAAELRQLAIGDAAGLSVDADGTVTDLPNLAGFDVALRLDGDRVAATLAELGAVPELGWALPGGGLVQGDISGEPGAWAVDVLARFADGADLAFDGTLARDADAGAPRAEGQVELTHPDGAAWLSRAWPAGFGWLAADGGALTLSGTVAGGPAGGEASLEQLSLGDTDGAGALSWASGSADGPSRPEVTADLAFDTLRLDDLGLRPAGALRLPAPAAAGGAGGWSHTPIETRALTAWQGTADITAESLAVGPWRLRDAAMEARLAEGRLAIPQAEARMGGGRVSAEAWVDAGRPPGLETPPAVGEGTPVGVGAAPAGEVQLRFDEAELAGALAGWRGHDVVGGQVDGQVTMTTSGRSPARLAAGLSGEVDLTVQDGTIHGADLAGLPAAVTQAGAGPAARAAAIRSRLRDPAATSPVETLRLVARLADGEADPLRLSAEWPGGTLALSGTGRVDRRRVALTGTLDLRGAGSKAGSTEVTVRGHPAMPSLTVTPGGGEAGSASQPAGGAPEPAIPTDIAPTPAPDVPASLTPAPAPRVPTAVAPTPAPAVPPAAWRPTQAPVVPEAGLRPQPAPQVPPAAWQPDPAPRVPPQAWRPAPPLTPPSPPAAQATTAERDLDQIIDDLRQ